MRLLPRSKPKWSNKLSRGLSQTRNRLVSGLERVLGGKKTLTPQVLEELEEVLILADVGVGATQWLMERLPQQLARHQLKNPSQVIEYLKHLLLEILTAHPGQLTLAPVPPSVIMVLGVNGVGKTTTIGKLAYRYRQQGYRVLLAAADTFRAAAIEQLEIWAERVGAGLIKYQAGADPAAVAYDALSSARARKVDILFIDTAGRLHTKRNLMQELEKMKRIIGRQMPDAPHETLLVLDATTGQNAIQQAHHFHTQLGLTGLVLTKLDASAKGGVVVGIVHELGIPVKLIGVGEGLEDLRDFEPQEFVSALFEGETNGGG